nr:hypothetical protein [Sedimentibacter sp.]
MYPYISFPGIGNLGDIEVTHSQILTKNDVQTVEVHFERATETGFETARCELPLYKWIVRDGFSDAEIKDFEEFLQRNAHLIFRFAARGGLFYAKSI